MSDTPISAEEARRLLEGAATDKLCPRCQDHPGREWDGCGCGPGVLHFADCGTRPPSCAMCDGQGVLGNGRERLIAAAPALAESVIALSAEVERLRAALGEIAEYGGGDGGDWVECCNIAAAALRDGDKT